MGLSSNTLWHQTKKDGLKGILKERRLYLSYSLEDVSPTDTKKFEFAFPMVSVCDLPLAETGNYLKKYGDYTIGLCADWGKRNHFSAVWYCYKNSIALKTIVEMLARKIEVYGENVYKDKDYQRIVYILSYIKKYEGALPKRNYKNYRFYDERELRFVPDADSLKEYGERPFLGNYETYKKTHNNSSLLNKSLNVPYEWDDIKYVIVEKDSEKLEFKNLIESLSGRTDLSISFFTNKEVLDDIIGMNHDEQDTPNNEFATEADIDEIFEKFKIMEENQLTAEYDEKNETLYFRKGKTK